MPSMLLKGSNLPIMVSLETLMKMGSLPSLRLNESGFPSFVNQRAFGGDLASMQGFTAASEKPVPTCYSVKSCTVSSRHRCELLVHLFSQIRIRDGTSILRIVSKAGLSPMHKHSSGTERMTENSFKWKSHPTTQWVTGDALALKSRISLPHSNSALWCLVLCLSVRISVRNIVQTEVRQHLHLLWRRIKGNVSLTAICRFWTPWHGGSWCWSC